MSLRICYTVSFVVEINSPEDYGLPATATDEEIVADIHKNLEEGDTYIEEIMDCRTGKDVILISVNRT